MTRFTVWFGRTSSPAYPDAVALAQHQADYWERGLGRRRVHGCSFAVGAAEVTRLCELWALIRGWQSARLFLDDTPVASRDRYRIDQILNCLRHALTFTPPARYCRSAMAERPTGYDGPILPCRLVMHDYPGTLIGIDWTAPEAIDAARARLMAFGVTSCPLLDFQGFAQLVEARRGGRGPLPEATEPMDELLRRLLDSPPGSEPPAAPGPAGA